VKQKVKSTLSKGVILRIWIYRITLLFAVAEVMLFLASWLLTAARPDMAMRSLLSAGGIRWFFGNFATNLADPVLVYLIVLAIACGSFVAGGLWDALRKLVTGKHVLLTSQQLFALNGSLLMFITEVAVVLLLTFLPHAILLSITGELFPSSFSDSIVPILAFIVTSVSVFYSLLSRRLHNVYEVGQAMSSSGRWLMPLLLLYVFASVFYHSFNYVFYV
jgi:p-aminobenzoyl-glutamate transporter AbgT